MRSFKRMALATTFFFSMLAPATMRVAQADPIACNKTAIINTASSAQLIAAVAGQSVYVCAFVLTAGTLSSAVFNQGTGSVCASNTAPVTGNMNVQVGGFGIGTGSGLLFQTTSAQALCVTVGAAQVTGFVSYAQQ